MSKQECLPVAERITPALWALAALMLPGLLLILESRFASGDVGRVLLLRLLPLCWVLLVCALCPCSLLWLPAGFAVSTLEHHAFLLLGLESCLNPALFRFIDSFTTYALPWTAVSLAAAFLRHQLIPKGKHRRAGKGE